MDINENIEHIVKSNVDLEKCLTNRDSKDNITFGSGVKFSDPCIVGIDEAGRGPVLGPMVYGLCYYPLGKESIFNDLGCADSKTLTDEKRKDIFQKMCSDDVGWIVEALSPTFISNNMLLRSKYSLNQIAQDSTVGLLNKIISMGINIAEVYVDTVGPPEKYQDKLKSIFPEFKIVVAKKADSLYPVVSAASICAKVSRDTALTTWVFTEDFEISLEEIGSGYPNDPVTKKFLKGNLDKIFGFPQLVRFSWSTADKILEDESFCTEWEDVEEGASEKTPNILGFFKKDPRKKEHAKHEFFKKRKLMNTENL
ncbi:Ribonuclease H2 subunit A [Gryllus bimaculatus]|nr:Ribonuclease H2 subunit A [Gryllus bimaculatus]